MEYSLTKHASDVIEEREIPLEYIERTIDNPDMIEPDSSVIELEHRLKKISECEGKILRVVINKHSTPIRIITVFFDRALRGKL